MKSLVISAFCVVIGAAQYPQGMGREMGLSRLRRHSLDPLLVEDGLENIVQAFILDERDLIQRLETAMFSGNLTPKCNDHLEEYAKALGGKDVPFWAIKSILEIEIWPLLHYQ